MVSEEQQNTKVHTRLEDPSQEQKFSPASLATAEEVLSLKGVFPQIVLNKGLLITEFSSLQTGPLNTKHLH